MRRVLAGAIGILLLIAAPARAQWLTIPLAGTPRGPDGQADLAAPAPRTPDGRIDLSGIWVRPRGPGSNTDIGTGIEVPFQPAAEAIYKTRKANGGIGTPSEGCLPHGITKAVSVFQPFKIIQTPNLLLVLYEEFNHHRQIFTDGRSFPARHAPTYFGYSIGTWEADSLVVDTKGFVDDSWLDFGGHPATAALHIIERYRRRDFGHLDVQFTIDDPKAYVKPWTVTLTYVLLPDTELIEHICENEKDAERLGRKNARQTPDAQVPRVPDANRSLTAPPPKTPEGKPDLSGVWRVASDTYQKNLAVDGVGVPLQPPAAALFAQRQSGQGKGNPSARCLPQGVPGVMLVREYPWKIVTTPAAVVILFDESLHYRQIFTDGRGFPDDPTPAWLGYSTGKWEGDTFVAETMGFTEETWLDDIGHPHGDALHVIERFHRRTVGTMDVDITIDDPKSYAKPWTATVRFELLPDTDLSEHVCAVS